MREGSLGGDVGLDLGDGPGQPRRESGQGCPGKRDIKRRKADAFGCSQEAGQEAWRQARGAEYLPSVRGWVRAGSLRPCRPSSGACITLRINIQGR